MKSIKEKSKEYEDEQDLRMAYNGSCDNCRQGFVAGANYVLDVIADVINKPMNDYLVLEELKKVILQLKK